MGGRMSSSSRADEVAAAADALMATMEVGVAVVVGQLPHDGGRVSLVMSKTAGLERVPYLSALLVNIGALSKAIGVDPTTEKGMSFIMASVLAGAERSNIETVHVDEQVRICKMKK